VLESKTMFVLWNSLS